MDDVPRTRASLLALRQSRADAREGHALLEHKREVLLREVAELLRVGRQHETRLRTALSDALGALRAARLDGGREAVDSALLVSSADTSCRVTPRSLMGVALPSVTLRVRPEPLTTSAGGTPASLDVARRRWLDTARELATWAETYGSVWRVANELARTQRRVNALEQVLIPEQEAAIRAIETMLEEADRESFVRTKRVKARLVRDRSEEPDA